MRREHLVARLCRALAGTTQEQFGKDVGVSPSLIARFEVGSVVPGLESLEAMAKAVGLTGADADAVLRYVETLRRTRLRQGEGAEDVLAGAAEDLRSELDETYRRLLTLPLPEGLPLPEDRARAGELFGRLENLPGGERLALVRWAEEYQSWALCERACSASVREASRNVESAAAWASLAREIAQRVRGPVEWRLRLSGYAAAHAANALRVAGDLKAAESLFEQARRTWEAGSDPYELLDPGKLADLQASLRLDQRRLAEALALLDEALAVSHRPERVLINKGSALELSGDHELAVETLLRAVPLVERQADRQLENVLGCNLASAYSRVGRLAEATTLAGSVRGSAEEMRDELLVLRIRWVQARVAAGLGQLGEARTLLADVRREFAIRGMDYDVALALLEEAALLLGEGRGPEVKGLALELARLFESKDVHAEALQALRIFRQAVEREQATAALAGSVLDYLLRSRYQQGLRFMLRG